jgi:hypothetical protein
MRLSIYRWTAFLCFLLIAGMSAGARAMSGQNSIYGTLKDQKGAVLTEAGVVIKNVDSGAAESIKTDREGHYRFANLPGGRYQVSASYNGFQTAIRKDIQIQGGREVSVDFELAILPKETVAVITAPEMMRPLVVETDPRAPRQPIPAHDGADYLKSIPGFSMIRKAGTLTGINAIANAIGNTGQTGIQPFK